MIKQLQLIILVLMLGLNTTSFSQLEYKDVAPIFINRCTSCHHPGKIFPHFTSYTGIKSYKSLISYDLSIGKMPPWSPDTSYSRFAHERIITQSEKTKIINWISAGTPAGDTTLAAQAPNYPVTQLNGTPDLVLTIPTYTSNATSTDKYVCFSLPTGLTQNRILRAYEVIPGNAPIVHHAVISVDTTGSTSNDLSGSCYSIPGDFSLGGYAPGASPTVFPGSAPYKFGVTIKAGSKIVLQMHYPKGSAGQTDNTQIRLFFYPIGETGVRPIYIGTPLQHWSFSIPANTTKTVTATYPINGDISAYAIFPHSHKICSSIENYASNGSTSIPLCKINKWDFEWQGFYTYKNFVKIPNGYTLYGSHVFDNTTNNPNNPTPVNVSAGLATSDEMVFDGLMWTIYQPGDENINIDSILQQDPLLDVTSSVKEEHLSSADIMAYPNPFSDKITISYTHNNMQFVNAKVLNVMGQEIKILSSRLEAGGRYTQEWDGKNTNGQDMPAGVYIYRIEIGNQQYTGKIILKPKN